MGKSRLTDRRKVLSMKRPPESSANFGLHSSLRIFRSMPSRGRRQSGSRRGTSPGPGFRPPATGLLRDQAGWCWSSRALHTSWASRVSSSFYSRSSVTALRRRMRGVEEVVGRHLRYGLRRRPRQHSSKCGVAAVVASRFSSRIAPGLRDPPCRCPPRRTRWWPRRPRWRAARAAAAARTSTTRRSWARAVRRSRPRRRPRPPRSGPNPDVGQIAAGGQRSADVAPGD